MLKKWLLLGTMIVGYLVLLQSPGLFAQGTPDGETPAQEGICDDLHGSTPGLYGLCVAYCEAQDLDDVVEKLNAGEVPGEKILAKYRAKMNDGDPDMPCIVSASQCPCFNIDVCNNTPGAPFRCDIPILSIADLFTGADCSGIDRCNNSQSKGDSAYDRCSAAGATTGIVVNVGEYSISNGPRSCLVQDTRNGENRMNVFHSLTTETARLCLDELNAYDGNGPADGNISNCGLSN